MAMAVEKCPQLPPTGRRQDYGKYIILGYADQDLWYNQGVLEKIARYTEMQVFGVEREFAVQDVAFNFRNGGSMTIAADADTYEAVGYSSQRLLAPTIDGYRRRIMFTTTRAVQKPYQGEGVGPELLRFSFNMHGAPDIVAGIMGWAPPVTAYYKSGVVAELLGDDRKAAEAQIQPSGDEELDEIMKLLATVKLYPFFKNHTESTLMSESLAYILQQSRYKGIHFEPETGLMKNLWEKDSTMLYVPEKASRRVEVIGQVLENKIHCDAKTGDAFVVMGPRKGWIPFLD